MTMDPFYLKGAILLLVLTIAVVTGSLHYRSMDIGTKIFYYLTILGLVSESLAYYAAFRYTDNLPVYNISSIIELFLLCLYFNYTIAIFRKRNFGWMIAVFSLIAGIINNFFIQSLHGISTNFLFYQAFVTITLSIISLSTFIKMDGPREAKKEVHFWLPVILIFSWSFTYLLFSLIAFYKKNVPAGVVLLLFLVSISTNMAIGLVFLFYPKLNTHVR
jgi:hypothetical protein